MSAEPTIRNPQVRVDEATLEALLEASAAINGSLDLQAVLQAIARSAADVLGAEASSVILLDRPRNKLVFKAAVGAEGAALVGEEFDATLGIAGRVASTGQPMLVPDVHRHPDFFGGFDEKSTFVTRGMVVAPLRVRGQTMGVVEVLNKRGGQPFDEHDVDLLQIFANLAATGVANAQTHENLKRENLGLREGAVHDDPIIGASAPLKDVLQLCDRVASTNATVLLLGETGTGKELTARRVHAMSPRNYKAFIAINCAALPETLLESELFGHEAGAFTGATKQRRGKFERAHGGTLFLDEVGDMPSNMQAKLLRVLQEGEIERVGGSKITQIDVRVVAATNKPLKKEIEEGRFRADLFDRLNVVPLRVPPLRERSEDVPMLAAHFLRQACTVNDRRGKALTEGAVNLLCRYDYPGNVRELRNLIERLVILTPADTISESDVRSFLPIEGGGATGGGYYRPGVPLRDMIDEAERDLILRSLEHHQQHITNTAADLGLERSHLYKKMKALGIKRD